MFILFVKKIYTYIYVTFFPYDPLIAPRTVSQVLNTEKDCQCLTFLSSAALFLTLATLQSSHN